MNHKHALTLSVAAIAGSAVIGVPTALAASGPKVSVRVEGLNRTLLTAETITTKTGTVERSGHPIVGTSALGALNTAVNGKWTGSWSSSFSEWEVIGIKGESHSFSSKAFWAVYVNNVQASSGAGEVKLRAGEKIVYAALPDAKSDEELLGGNTAKTATVGKPTTLKVVAYNSKGKAVPLKGAKVSYDGKTVTAPGSSVKIKPTRSGKLTVTISKTGFVRDEATITVKK
jgi:Domain of unknown function (DUF4430)